MFQSLFQFLFEYRPAVFAQGEFRFDPSPGSYAAALLALGAMAAVVFTYWRRSAQGTTRHRIVLTGFRLAALALVVACLFRPVLIVQAAVSQQNFVGVLLDDSGSMRIADWNAQPRAAFLQRHFGSAGSPLMSALADRFVVRTFGFSSTTTRIASADDLTFAGRETRLAAALDAVRQELAGLPMSGLILVSDGADTTDASLAESLLALRAAGIPVFTVGVGQERLPRDIEVARVVAPRTALKGTSLVVDVMVTHNGYSGEAITIDVEDEGRIVGTQEVRLGGEGEATPVRVRFTASDPGPRVFRFRVPPRPGELITGNNMRDVLVHVRDERDRVLYFEGEPRFEVKFIRRALTEDDNLQLVVLQRTADNKYLRLDVDSPDELVTGFPTTREELFQYRGLILGSVEAAAFTGDQLRMIAEFVDRRGGGLLMLGGPRAFAQGGYAGTPVADALPVMLEGGPAPVDPAGFLRLSVGPTRAGEAHAVTQVAATPSESLDRWQTLPAVTSVNPISSVKPGAVVLLTGRDQGNREHVALAYQRYGRGKSIAFPVQDSWIWQMHASISVEDPTHENYWRQLLRWLVDDVPGPVEVRPATERVEPGAPATVTAQVVDRSFLELDDAQVMAYVSTPNGDLIDVPLQWTGERSGEYRGRFVTAEEGIYEARVEASRAGELVGAGVAHVRAAPEDAEYFNPALQAAQLRRIAAETGGRFYTPETMAALPEDLRYTGRGVTTVEERELWHMPIVLLLLGTLICAEWGYRRVVGLA